MDRFCPFANRVFPSLPTKGRYEKGHPRGAVIHFTAGAYGLSELDLARQLGYTYFLIDEHGGIHQGFPLDRWGSHAGKSEWKPLGPGNVSKHLVGIEVDCAGKLSFDMHGNFYTWWKKLVPYEDVRVVVGNDNQVSGCYQAFKIAQEEALTKLILWLKSNQEEAFDFDLVLGHDEVSPGRKNDPGGSLSMTMPAYRRFLKDAWILEKGVRSPVLTPLA